MKETGDPDIVTHNVKGSLPICSCLKPCVFVTEPGTVTGTGWLHVLPFVDTVNPVMLRVTLLMVYAMLAAQASLAMRLANDVAIYRL